ncbi:hypothetical protein B0H13DRAFT_1877695 [Mycena leptocephala]|nr:hypothetical protein B0H13DRAFT_1877695 [Mycena leptocephala]
MPMPDLTSSSHAYPTRQVPLPSRLRASGKYRDGNDQTVDDGSDSSDSDADDGTSGQAVDDSTTDQTTDSGDKTFGDEDGEAAEGENSDSGSDSSDTDSHSSDSDADSDADSAVMRDGRWPRVHSASVVFRGLDCIKEDGESKDLADEIIPGKRTAHHCRIRAPL